MYVVHAETQSDPTTMDREERKEIYDKNFLLFFSSNLLFPLGLSLTHAHTNTNTNTQNIETLNSNRFPETLKLFLIIYCT